MYLQIGVHNIVDIYHHLCYNTKYKLEIKYYEKDFSKQL
jgi:hypothetical protein